MKQILIIEDDPAILKGLESILKTENYNIVSYMDGIEGYKSAKMNRYDVIILDIMLPQMDGMQICKELRKDGINTPILILTSKKEEMDKVLGLELGADDYVTKPFSIRELLARIRALQRRKGDILREFNNFNFDGISIDFKKNEALKHGALIKLSVLEFKILKYFIQKEGEVISRDQMLDDVWGYDVFPTTRTVDNYILSIRKKIEDDFTDPKHIVTVHKGGYKFIT